MKTITSFLLVSVLFMGYNFAQLQLSYPIDQFRKAPTVADQAAKRPLLRATLLSTGYNLTAGAALFALPTSITHWRRESFLETAGPNLRQAWSSPPVWDRDNFYINYVGHPYQGAYYYNTLRSQGQPIWKSGLFLAAQTFLWEYGFEAIKEHPSRQDLITTPIGGLLIGELTHRLTIRMKRGGFTFWEKTFVTLFNPAYVLNNGYR